MKPNLIQPPSSDTPALALDPLAPLEQFLGGPDDFLDLISQVSAGEIIAFGLPPDAHLDHSRQSGGDFLDLPFSGPLNQGPLLPLR